MQSNIHVLSLSGTVEIKWYKTQIELLRRWQANLITLHWLCRNVFLLSQILHHLNLSWLDQLLFPSGIVVVAWDMNINTGHCCINGIMQCFSLWIISTQSHEQRHVQSSTGLAERITDLNRGWYRQVGAVPVLFCSPVTVRGRRNSRPSFSTWSRLAMIDGRLMRQAEVTASEQKHYV